MLSTMLDEKNGNGGLNSQSEGRMLGLKNVKLVGRGQKEKGKTKSTLDRRN